MHVLKRKTRSKKKMSPIISKTIKRPSLRKENRTSTSQLKSKTKILANIPSHYLNKTNQILIPHSVELQKANLQESNNQSSSSPSAGGSNTQSNSTTSLIASSNSNNSLASAIPLAQLLTKPGALNALTSLSALGGLSDLLGGLASNIGGPPVQTTGVHRQKNFTPRVRSPNSMNERGRNDRNKFNPY